MKLRLFGYWRSSCTWRVRIALHYKGLAFESVPVHLVHGGGEQHAEPFARQNPMRQVPMLELVADGETYRVSQSLAILELLEELHPEPALLPTDPFARARARQLAELLNAGTQPLQNLSVLGYVKNAFGADSKAWASEWVQRGLAALEIQAAGSAGRFLVGDTPTFADLCLVPQLYNARRFDVALDPFPTLVRIEAECERLAAFQAARPERQADAPAGG